MSDSTCSSEPDGCFHQEAKEMPSTASHTTQPTDHNLIQEANASSTSTSPQQPTSLSVSAVGNSSGSPSEHRSFLPLSIPHTSFNQYDECIARGNQTLTDHSNNTSSHSTSSTVIGSSSHEYNNLRAINHTNLQHDEGVQTSDDDVTRRHSLSSSTSPSSTHQKSSNSVSIANANHIASLKDTSGANTPNLDETTVMANRDIADKLNQQNTKPSVSFLTIASNPSHLSSSPRQEQISVSYPINRIHESLNNNNNNKHSSSSSSPSFNALVLSSPSNLAHLPSAYNGVPIRMCYKGGLLLFFLLYTVCYTIASVVVLQGNSGGLSSSGSTSNGTNSVTMPADLSCMSLYTHGVANSITIPLAAIILSAFFLSAASSFLERLTGLVSCSALFGSVIYSFIVFIYIYVVDPTCNDLYRSHVKTLWNFFYFNLAQNCFLFFLVLLIVGVTFYFGIKHEQHDEAMNERTKQVLRLRRLEKEKEVLTHPKAVKDVSSFQLANTLHRPAHTHHLGTSHQPAHTILSILSAQGHGPDFIDPQHVPDAYLHMHEQVYMY